MKGCDAVFICTMKYSRRRLLGVLWLLLLAFLGFLLLRSCGSDRTAAAVSGYFAVRFMIKLITKHSLWGFAIYTAILGAFIVLDQNILHLIAW